MSASDLPRYGALDLAAKTGVCAGAAHTRSPEFETWDLSGLTNGERCLTLLRRLPAWLDRWKFTAVAIEAPLSAHISTERGTNPATTLQLHGYIFVAQGVCESRGVRSVLMERQKCLMHFTGHARYSEKNGAKIACYQRAKMMGWQVDNWDEADAGAMWDAFCAQEQSKAFLERAGEAPVKFRKAR